MEKEQINALIDSYRTKSKNVRKYDEEKRAFFDRIVGQIELSFDEYLDDSFETEEDVINDVKEQFDEVDGFYEFEE